MSKMFKVTTKATSYTHYWVEAESAEEAEDNYEEFVTVKDDPLYGDAEEEVLKVEELGPEEVKEVYKILEEEEKEN